MSKSVDTINRALKLKTKSGEGMLTVKLGRNKFTLPFETRYLASAEYVFIHIPPAAGTMKIVDGELKLVTDSAEAVAAQKSFREPRKGRAGRKERGPVEMPAELQKALSAIPTGYKLAYNADGSPKLVKTRNRSKK
jgi:hypothetical protein